MNLRPARDLDFAAICLSACLALAGAAAPAAAGQTEKERAATPQTVPPPAVPPRLEQVDAGQTRRELIELLNRHPPAVGRVLKLDPSLLRNDAYLSAYPQLRQFLAAYPDIPLNASYYLDPVQVYAMSHQPRSQQVEMIEGILAGFAGLIAATVGIGALFWLVRTVLDQRRWNRLSKIQAEVHSKLMDRFSSNDELLTYVQTPSGRRFLESGPSPLPESSAPAVAAPFARILWSVQIGAVLLVSGFGLLMLSRRTTALAETAEFFYIAGSLTSTLGAGFVVSAIAAYFLSRRLGLFESIARDHA